MSSDKKSVVVLTHVDGWGVLSANKVVRHLNEHYPNFDIYLIASKATRSKKTGEIATKLDDLKLSRKLKEEDFSRYLAHIDWSYLHRSNDNWADGECFTLNNLARHCCADKVAHFTSRGGFVGGKEVQDIIEGLDISPEIILSVDTMAILPAELTERYRCFSTHPGPLQDVKVAGMQGTARQFTQNFIFDRDGNLLPEEHVFGSGFAYLKGTLFLQAPILDEGPAIDETMSYICPGMCAYQMRAEVYHSLTDKMIERLPVLLDPVAREDLIVKAKKRKLRLENTATIEVPELTSDNLTEWQKIAIGYPDDTALHGVGVVQNQIVDPHFFLNEMRRYWPNMETNFDEAFFLGHFQGVFGETLMALDAQSMARADPWARYFMGDPNIEIRHHNPKTGEVVRTFRNE